MPGRARPRGIESAADDCKERIKMIGKISESRAGAFIGGDTGAETLSYFPRAIYSNIP